MEGDQKGGERGQGIFKPSSNFPVRPQFGLTHGFLLQRPWSCPVILPNITLGLVTNLSLPIAMD